MVRAKLKRRAQKEQSSGDFSGRLVALADPNGPPAEALRALRTNLLYAVVDAPPRVLMLTSPGPTEGKSTVCANLGVTLAQAEQSTLILDCDLRKPMMHRTFDLRNFRGLSNVLIGESAPEQVSQTVIPNLKVMTAGPVPPNPAELLSSERFAGLLGRMREEFDYVLIDAPPVELVADPAIVAARAEGTLLVVDAQRTHKRAIRQSMHTLEAVGANVIGTVMNNVAVGKGGYYYGYAYR
jgi:capsular exopolysaccharide synthesis family protein